jgi:hypothetical protein
VYTYSPNNGSQRRKIGSSLEGLMRHLQGNRKALAGQ